MKETNFKHTDIGDIPHDWKLVQLGEVGYTYNGITGKSAKDFGKGGAAYITFLNVLNNPIIDTSILESVDIAKSESQNSVMKGDLFFNTSSETPEDVGTCAVLLEDVDNVYLNSFCFGYRLTDSSILGKYLAYYFRSKQGRNLMTKLAQGATRYNLSKVNFNNSYIPLPPTLSEQERIATALSDMDKLLAHLDLMIDKTQLIKQAAMQQLLTGKTRLQGFSEPWKEIKLGEILDYEQPTEYLVASTEYSEKGTPVLTAGKTFILGYTQEKWGIYKNTPVILFDDFVAESKYVDFPFKVKSSAAKMLKLHDNQNNLRFVYELMQLIDFPVIDHKRRWISEYSQIEISIPSLPEQQAIASTLTAMDEEIQALQSQRDKYALIKQGMMQQLLTGKTRI